MNLSIKTREISRGTELSDHTESDIKALDRKGVIHSISKVEDLDEAPSAYKDIDVVMKNQEDLVEVVHTLTPLAVIKG